VSLLPPETAARIGRLREALQRLKNEIVELERLENLPGYPEIVGISRVLSATEGLREACGALSDGQYFHAPAEVGLWVIHLLELGPFDESSGMRLRPGYLEALERLLTIVADETILLDRSHLPPPGLSDKLLAAQRAEGEARVRAIHAETEAIKRRNEALEREFEALLRAKAEIRPHWDRDRRQLWYGETLCRDFSRAAPAQFRILDAFQAAKWATRIKAPFTEKQLRDTIGHLNKGLEPGSPLEFAPDGPSHLTWKLKLR
jgi:hypothetical protein